MPTLDGVTVERRRSPDGQGIRGSVRDRAIEREVEFEAGPDTEGMEITVPEAMHGDSIDSARRLAQLIEIACDQAEKPPRDLEPGDRVEFDGLPRDWYAHVVSYDDHEGRPEATVVVREYRLLDRESERLTEHPRSRLRRVVDDAG